MSACASLATNGVLPTPPVSTAPSRRPSTQDASRYPPGVGAIITGSSSKRRKDAESGAHGVGLSSYYQPGTAQPLTPESSGSGIEVYVPIVATQERSVSPTTLQTDAAGRDVLNHATQMSARETAVRMVQNTVQSLRQIRDGMYTTMREYFHWDIVIHLFEVPSYKPLRRSLNRLIETLECFERMLVDDKCVEGDTAVKVLCYAIKLPLDAVVGEGLTLLAGWNRRDVGQKLGEPLTGKNRTLRAITIHDSDSRLHNLKTMVVITDALVLQELRERQPQLKKTRKVGKAWKWLGYFKPVCPVVGECQHETHQRGFVR